MEESEATLMALIFDDPYRAHEAWAALLRMEGEGLLEIAESAVLVKKADGSFKLTQETEIASDTERAGHVLAALAANLTGVGAIFKAGKFAFGVYRRFDPGGVSDFFIREMKSHLTTENSLLLLRFQLDDERRGQVIERLSPYNARILTSNLTFEAETEADEEMEAAAVRAGH